MNSFKNPTLPGCREGWPLVLVLYALLAGSYCFGQERQTSGAVEKFAPVFDVGIVYQPKPGEYGITELMNTALAGDAQRVDDLIQTGADIDAVDDGGATALIRAAAYDYIDIVNLLLAANADPQPISNDGRSALSVAVEYKSSDVALALIGHGANPDTYLNSNRPEYRRSVLEHAAVTGQTSVVLALIENGADLSVNGPKALNAALWQGHSEIAAALINSGLDINAKFGDPNKPANLQTGRVALQTAAQGGHVDLVEMLLRHGANIEAANHLGETALHYAIRNGHLPVVSTLLANGAAVSVENLSVALQSKNSQLTHELMQHVNTEVLSLADIELLIGDADRAGEDEVTITLFAARALLKPETGPPLFLFARSDDENCELALWHPNGAAEQVVYEESGACSSQFLVSDDKRKLLVVSDGNIQVISLDGGKHQESISIPTELINTNLAALKIRVRNTYGSNAGNAEDWMAADIVQVGPLKSGELALVTHTGGPTDETYAYMYARSEDAWRIIETEDCGRFDDCRFSQVLSQSLNVRPSELAVWHPNVRINPYFRFKSVTRDPQGEWAGWNGTIVLNIDGETSMLQYSIDAGEHCYDDCIYTSSLRLQLPGKEDFELAIHSGNNSIVDRYALVWRQPKGSSELVDLATGESVFGKLQLSGWIN